MGALKKRPEAEPAFSPRASVKPDLKAVRADIDKRFANALDYLGR